MGRDVAGPDRGRGGRGHGVCVSPRAPHRTHPGLGVHRRHRPTLCQRHCARRANIPGL